MTFPRIEQKFVSKFPAGYVNDIRGWTFSRQEILDAASERKLLTLDIDIPGKGNCSLRCPSCFRRTPDFKQEKRMDMRQFEELVEEAKGLGLRSVKLIGPGEPLEEKNLLATLEFFSKHEIVPLIFTKGHPLSAENEKSLREIHGMTGAELIAKLNEYGASILLSATSFIPEVEDTLVGKAGQCERRNEALVRLAEAGFADFVPNRATRLALISAPVTPKNIAEMFGINVWAKMRNIQHILTPTMVAGKAKGNLYEIIPSEKDLLDLYVKINVWNIEKGAFMLSELEKQGIAPYAAASPCNQIAIGMFVLGSGKVLRCPGDDVSVQGDLGQKSLTQIWNESENLNKYGGRYNNGCPPKRGISFPEGFFEKVMQKVKEHFGA